MEAEPLAYADSINIDRYGLFQARDVIKADGDWLVMSSAKGDYNLLFASLEGAEHFFAVRRGRGPGEMPQGSSLHKSGKYAVYYDVNAAACLRIDCAETIREGRLSADTLALNAGPSRPVYVRSCGADGFISGNMSDPGVWYSYYDTTGKILSGVPALHSEGFQGRANTACSI